MKQKTNAPKKGQQRSKRDAGFDRGGIASPSAQSWQDKPGSKSPSKSGQGRTSSSISGNTTNTTNTTTSSTLPLHPFQKSEWRREASANSPPGGLPRVPRLLKRNPNTTSPHQTEPQNWWSRPATMPPVSGIAAPSSTAAGEAPGSAPAKTSRSRSLVMSAGGNQSPSP